MKNTIFPFRLFWLLFLTIPLLHCKQNQQEVQVNTAADTTAVAPPASARPVHWGYQGDAGPAQWGTLSPAYALCKDGQHQSPIDIVQATVKGSNDWAMKYSTTSLHILHTEHMDNIIDNGHTIQVNVDTGSTITYAGKEFHLKQFHFHTPSEHMINGNHMPMEMHLVHQSDDGALAVVGVLIKEGKESNPNFDKIIANFPAAKGESKHLTDHVLTLPLHLPKDISAYHYTGSLTTPPCSENVQWLVLKETISLSKAQIEAFSTRIGPNNRPVQPLNDRAVNADDVKDK